MRKAVRSAVTCALAVVPMTALAADPPPEHTVTGNIGLYSQYIFRGLTQTDRDPALQGGFDYAHGSGLYAGAWASNISWLRDGGAYRSAGSGEFDFYGGYKMTFGDFTGDIGTLYYRYPGDATIAPAGAAAANPKADTHEIYGALGWKWLNARFSYSLRNKTFAVLDSRGTYYIDLSANVPLGEFAKPLTGLTLMAHYGMQKYRGTDPRNVAAGGVQQSNDALYSYNDWKLGLSYTLPKDLTIGAFYTDTSGANVLGYGATTQCVGGVCGIFPRNIAKGTGTVYIQKTF